MIKLFASDLDGTLLNLLHRTDGTITRSIREVIDAGAHFAVATGRTMRSNGDFGFEGLGCEAICANGSMVIDGSGELVRHVTIRPDLVEELLGAFPTIPFECVGTSHSYVRGSEAALQDGFRTDGLVRRVFTNIALSGMRKALRARDERRFDCTDAQVLAHDICKVNCRVPDAGLARELAAFLADHTDAVVNAPFNPVMFEITAAGVNKGEAVAWLANYLGIREDEVAVYGDGGNDVVMLARYAEFGHAYAPRGASEGAKRVASEIIGSCAFHAVPRHMVRTVRAGA